MPYRNSNTWPRLLKKRPWLRPLCWFLGHRWHVTRINGPKHIALLHLHSCAGYDQFCVRCGFEWNDFDGDNLWYGGVENRTNYG